MTSQKLEMVFESNPNKDFLRSNYDKPLIEQWYRSRGKPLKYLGLPAWKMLDIIEWQDFLEHFTTIEREEDQQHLMFLRANVKDLEHRLHALYGEFDDLLITGRDKYGKTPQWPYDVVNLDYFGGFIYPNLARLTDFTERTHPIINEGTHLISVKGPTQLSGGPLGFLSEATNDGSLANWRRIQLMAKERTSVRMQTQIKLMSEQGHSIRTYRAGAPTFTPNGTEVFGAAGRADRVMSGGWENKIDWEYVRQEV